MPTQSENLTFPEGAVCAYPVFYKNYSRRLDNGEKETWQQTCDRTLAGTFRVGEFNSYEKYLVDNMQRQLITLPSGRWLWTGNTDWQEKGENFPGAFNCASLNIDSWEAFGLMLDLSMQGTGTGAVLESRYLSKLPPICNRLKVKILGEIGESYGSNINIDQTRQSWLTSTICWLTVGDSRQGWVNAYRHVLEIASDQTKNNGTPDFVEIELLVDLSYVRPAGTPLKGFGGVANPVKLPEMFLRVASILNGALGRQLTAVESCLLIDEAAVTAVAGNIRRSAGIRQFPSNDAQAAIIKMDLWQQDKDGNWKIDPERDALRMANHTRVFHQKPTFEECIDSVRKQYDSGEGNTVRLSPKPGRLRVITQVY